MCQALESVLRHEENERWDPCFPWVYCPPEYTDLDQIHKFVIVNEEEIHGVLGEQGKEGSNLN